MGGLRGYATALTLAALVSTGAGCGGDDAAGPDLPSFNDITSAPAPIQTAAAAVVRIGTADGSATGCFISADGLLLTNNHVLGAEECPVEGCSFELRFMFQRGQPVTDAVQVRGVPVAVDVGLDVAMLRVTGPSGPLATPSFLEINAQDAASLIGQHVTVVGHPEGRLKKWTDGVVFDASGDWFTSDTYVLPGDSGSPVLDDDGKLIGIHHRSPRVLDGITDRGVNVSATGTAGAAILAARDAPLPSVMIAVAAPTTAERVVAHDVVYQNGNFEIVSVGGASSDVLDLLAQACDAALARDDFASPDELTDALLPCTDAQRWIECRFDANHPAFATSCPAVSNDWLTRLQRRNDKWIAMNGSPDLFAISFGVAALRVDESSGVLAGADGLRAALAATPQALDFTLANYLAAFGIADYQGTDTLAWLRAYRNQPAWANAAHSIASAFLWWNHNHVVGGDETTAVLQQLLRDPDVDVGTKLYVDVNLYLAGH